MNPTYRITITSDMDFPQFLDKLHAFKIEKIEMASS